MTPLSKTAILKTTACLALLSAGLLAASAMAVTVSPDTVRRQVVAHVKTHLASLMQREDQAQIQVNVLNVPSASALDFPDAAEESAVSLEASSILDQTYSSRAVVRVRLSDGATSREIGVPVQISIKKPVWVVKNLVNAQEPLKRSDFALEMREVSVTYGHAVGLERDLGQYIARVNLHPGEILDDRKMIIPPDITRNSEVRIFMTNGQGMTVTVPGIAMDDGRIGQQIKVRHQIYKRKYFTAKVLDKHRVLVEI